jgi:hypothetical protein
MTTYDFTGANCKDEIAWPDDWHPNTSNGRNTGQARYDAVTLCAGCPHTSPCASLSLTVPMVSGIWAGVFIPAAAGPGRTDALKRIRKIARVASPPILGPSLAELAHCTSCGEPMNWKHHERPEGVRIKHSKASGQTCYLRDHKAKKVSA